MSIQVRSNEVTEVNTTAATAEPTQSAPEAHAPTEQKESSESDTEETEASQGETDESGDSEDHSDESKDDAKDKPKKKGGFQRRIDKLNARYSAAQQEVEYWRQLALKQTGAGEPKKEPVESKQPAVADGKPNPDHFDTHAEYVEALADWKTEQKLKERDQKLEKTKLEIEQANTLKAHSDRVKSFAEKTDDFADVLESVDDIPVSTAVQEIIISSENGPELMYELAKNRDEYARICKLPPLAAARELGRIESRIASKASESKPETKKLTKAPKPIGPVGGSKGAVVKSIDDPGLSQAEYEKLRREQMKRRSAF